MPKISKISIKTIADLKKQRKLEQILAAKEKAAAIQAAKDLQFDEFVRNTARDIIKTSFKYDLKVFDAQPGSKIS